MEEAGVWSTLAFANSLLSGFWYLIWKIIQTNIKGHSKWKEVLDFFWSTWYLFEYSWKGLDTWLLYTCQVSMHTCDSSFEKVELFLHFKRQQNSTGQKLDQKKSSICCWTTSKISEKLSSKTQLNEKLTKKVDYFWRFGMP